jgi:hypothetical protein
MDRTAPMILQLENRIREQVTATVQPMVDGWVDQMVSEQVGNTINRVRESLGLPPEAVVAAPRSIAPRMATDRIQGDRGSDRNPNGALGARLLEFLAGAGPNGVTANEAAPAIYPKLELAPAIKAVSALLHRTVGAERIPNSGRPQRWRVAGRS